MSEYKEILEEISLFLDLTLDEKGITKQELFSHVEYCPVCSSAIIECPYCGKHISLDTKCKYCGETLPLKSLLKERVRKLLRKSTLRETIEKTT